MKYFCFIVSLGLMTFSGAAWATGENEFLDHFYQSYVEAEVLWDADDQRYTQVATQLSESLRDFLSDESRQLSSVNHRNQVRLSWMSLKLADFLFQQRSPRQKNNGQELENTRIQYPELNEDRLQMVDVLYTSYLIFAQLGSSLRDWQTPVAAGAYYFRGTARMIFAQTMMERVLAGEFVESERDRSQVLKQIIDDLYGSIQDFQNAKTLNERLGFGYVVGDELVVAQELFGQAHSLYQAQSNRPGVR